MKSIAIHFEHDAVVGVPVNEVVPPDRIVPAKILLIDKSDEPSVFAPKARLCVGGHRDPDGGKYETTAPTAQAVAHRLLLQLAVLQGWTVWVADVSAAFLQGQPLQRETPIYFRVSPAWPPCAHAYIDAHLGKDKRRDLLRAVKGLFGFGESPRLWYLEFRRILTEELSFHELRTAPCVFVWFYECVVAAAVSIHVDDLKAAGNEHAEPLWVKLKARLQFGEWTSIRQGVTHLGARYRQDDDGIEIDIKDYTSQIRAMAVPQPLMLEETVTEAQRRALMGLNGQLGWAAREVRADLACGVSLSQQSTSGATQADLQAANTLARRAARPAALKIGHLGCSPAEVIVVAAGDASLGTSPRSGSQAGVAVVLTSPAILDGHAACSLVEWASTRIKRVVRSSTAAEVHGSCLALEYATVVRCMWAELTQADFDLKHWRRHASKHDQLVVLDARTVFDALEHERTLSDRRASLDLASLRESLADPAERCKVKWVPGPQQLADGLTKRDGNDVLLDVMSGKGWSFKESEEVAALRAQQRAYRKELRSRT